MEITLDKVFEYYVAVLMRRNGYRVGVPGRMLDGRGAKHQIDAIGIYPFAAPFTFPVRLVSEAKCYTPDDTEKQVSLPVVRNLQAVLADLQQTLPRMRELRLDEQWEEHTSCSYHGAIFATVPFSGPATAFANSYGIDLVPIDGMVLGGDPLPLIQNLREALITCIGHHGSHFRTEKGDDYPPDAWSALDRARTYGSLQAKSSARRLMLDMVEFILTKCAKDYHCARSVAELEPLRRALFQSRLGSVDGHVTAFSMDDESFQRLRLFTARRFYMRAGGGEGTSDIPDPFYPPPDTSAGEDSQDGSSPYAHVFMEHAGRGGGTRGSGGSLKRVEFYMAGENPDGSRAQVRAKAVILGDLMKQLQTARHPRKIIIPVDFGCFYYGLLC